MFFVPSLLYIFVGNWCQSLIPQIPGWVWILIFIAVNTAINIKGIETTARVDMFFFVVEIGIVLIIVIGGLKYVLGGGGAGELTMTPIYQADKVNLTFIATACTIAALNLPVLTASARWLLRWRSQTSRQDLSGSMR